MPSIAEVLAALAAAGITLDDAPASAPVQPVAASPFAVLRTVSDRKSSLPAPIAEAMAAAPDGKRQQTGREAAAYFGVSLYSCDAAARQMSGPDGVRTVGHGFISKRDAGTACPTTGCTGAIRA